MTTQKPETIRCSFCNRGLSEVKKLIAGTSAHICNECIELATQIIAEECRAITKLCENGKGITFTFPPTGAND